MDNKSTSQFTHQFFGHDQDETAWYRRLREYDIQANPNHLGNYELLGEIGRGGQGVVFKARQPRTGRLVALKRLSAGAFATVEMRARFEREIEALLALDHPGVVTVYGAENIDGQALLVMQWIDGVPINEWARPAAGPRRTTKQILQLFLSACEAVQHAHQRGVIHRDLKPSNILVDADDRAHVLDFGLAKLQAEGQPLNDMTETGQFLGTPAFAAPEQVVGGANTVDVRTDVYGLGVVLYQSLTGTTPFAEVSAIPDLLQAIVSQDPPAASARRNDLDRDIDAILHKTLAKNKDDRYPSIEAFAGDLRDYLAGKAVSAHPPSTVYKIRKFVRQHRRSVLVASVLVVVLICSTLISTTLYLRSEQERLRANEERDAAKEALRIAEAHRWVAEDMRFNEKNIREFLFGLFTAYDGDNPAKVELIKNGASRAIEAASGTPLRQASLLNSLGMVYSGLGVHTNAFECFEKASEIYRNHLKPEDKAYSETLANLAWSLRELRQFDRAEALQREVLDLRRHTHGAQHVFVGAAWGGLAHVLSAAGKHPDAEQAFREAIANFEFSKIGSEKIAGVHIGLGRTLRLMSRTDEAEREFRRGLALLENVEHSSVFTMVDAKNSLGELYMRQRKTSEAEPLFRSAYDQARITLGPEHGTVVYSLTNLAWATWFMGEFDEAARYYQEVCSVRTRVLGDSHPYTLSAKHQFANLLRDMKRHTEAIELLEEIIKLRRAKTTEEDPELVATKVDLGTNLTAIGELTSAQTLLQEALSVRERILPAGDYRLAFTRGAMSDCLMGLAKFEEAEPLALQCAQVAEGNSTISEKERNSTFERVCRIYEATGRPEKAREYRALMMPMLPVASESR